MAANPGKALIFLAALVLAATCAGLAAARGLEQPYSFASTPGKLPKTVVPSHYAIALRPDLKSLGLPGSMVVDIDVAEPVDRIVLNALEMTIDRAVIDDDPSLAATVTLDAAAQTATLAFPRPIAAGKHRLAMAFAGRIYPYGRGLFHVDYPTDQGRKRMIGSQLEPADARRIFPSWDEPAFKASFALTVDVPADFMAVSNMPVLREEPVDASTKRVSFAATPRMSSYLFVLVAGEMERVTREAEGVTIGIVAAKGRARHGQFALDESVRLLQYFNEYFDTPYPLPKLDLIALPGGFWGAMENWGGITFFEPRLLFDPETSASGARRNIFAVLAHEMAHLWFGDLVTMAWWDNLWLNEGFASWMQNKAADVLHPDWRVWLNGSDSKQWAMAQDARRTTHPIQQKVTNEGEAMSVFDGITYNKGQAFIRMLEAYLGEDAFRAGIRQYMRRHAYGSTTTADLWRALEEASGKPVASVAARFTEQGGVPLVVAERRCADGEQRLALRQERFAVNDPGAPATQWQVPVLLGPFAPPAPPQSILLVDKAEVAAGKCDEPIKLNLGDVGYYRVQYDDATYDALTRNALAMAPADRFNLLADAWAMAEARRAGPELFLRMLDAIAGDTNRAVWGQAIRTLNRIDYLQRGRSERAAFQAYARKTLRPVFDRLGWDRKPGEHPEDGFLRAHLIRALGDLDDADILSEVRRRFDRFVADKASLHVDLRGVVAHLAGRTADRATYDALHRLARATTITDERQRYYYAMAAARDPTLAPETFALTLGDELPNHMVWGIFTTVAYDGEHLDMGWKFVRDNYNRLSQRQDQGFRNGFVPDLLSKFPSRRYAAMIADFTPVHENPGGRIAAARAIERLNADAEQRLRLLPVIDAWAAARAGKP